MISWSGRTGFRLLAYTSIALAAIGVVLPLVPTTPFVLLAAWSASKGSPVFAAWLENHQFFGPAIENWRDRRAIPVKAKWLACGMLCVSWAALFMGGAATVVLVATGLMFLGLACYLLTRASC
ncbi:YbaN family protein [Marinobacter sp. TBZ242]|uniref:Inner membrane protein n=2 Tax=Marinobacter azerbaijanicus TaxID=3050455 RepID=A0ABT7IB33_9GAMM|nr:YbaN family protein [Marinobacter sp. TBZ242]MDL0431372.1 YbaN family protein [Marinobacter sp. TBZ242]